MTPAFELLMHSIIVGLFMGGLIILMAAMMMGIDHVQMAHALPAPGRRVVDSRFFWVYHLFGLVVNSGDGLMAAPKGIS